MAQYKFDWTAKISGAIEIDAENGIEFHAALAFAIAASAASFASFFFFGGGPFISFRFL